VTISGDWAWYEAERSWRAADQPDLDYVDMQDDTIDLLRRALDQTAVLVAGVRPDQLTLPTPCSEWDVRTLLRHVICKDLPIFAVAARGETADWRADPAPLGDNPAGDFRRGAKTVIDAWNSADLDRQMPGPGGSTVPLRSRIDQQLAELAVHGWDIARATSQPAELDPEVAQHSLDWSNRMLRPEHRGPDKAFGHEVPVAGDAPVYDRLAGWFGRDPGWSP
jgi:uncharacterized protein (TIGR03086 family)